jgi:hypothetical protein
LLLTALLFRQHASHYASAADAEALMLTLPLLLAGHYFAD